MDGEFVEDHEGQDPSAEPLGSHRKTRALLAISMFVMGACGLIYEYVLSVLGNYLIGSSHEEIFVIIGIMMFAMGFGSFVQRAVKKDLLDKFLLLEIVLGLVGGFSASLVYYLFAVSESYRVVLYSLSFLVGALIGMEIPILIRINREYASSLRTNLSEILSMDYAGALVGALLFAYVLLTNMSLTQIGYSLGLANAAIAGVGYLFFRRHLVAKIRLGAAVLFTIGALIFGFFAAPEWNKWAEQRYFADPIVHRETTRYQHLVLTQSSRTGISRLYLNGHLQFCSQDEHIYHECLVHPAMAIAPSRRKVLVLGGGDGLVVRECLKYDDVESVTLVELDPVMTRLASEHPILVELNDGALLGDRVTRVSAAGISDGEIERPEFRSQRPSQKFGDPVELPEVRIRTIDAELFLREVTGPYDVAILDFPDPSRLEVAKLYSQTFYRELASRLEPTAVVAAQSTSPFHAKLVFLCIGETLRAAGFSAVPYHQTVPSFGVWGFHVATLGTGRESELDRRLREVDAFAVETRYLTPAVLTGALHFGKDALTLGPDDPEIEPHTRLEPVLIRYHRRSWRSY